MNTGSVYVKIFLVLFMRMRKKWWAVPALVDSNKAYFWPEENKGKWKDFFGNDNPIHLDIGCGSGSYCISLAKNNPDRNFILWDKEAGVLVYALEQLEKYELNNALIIPREIDHIDCIFDENEISSITIHFPNPWPKNRQNNRRLTYPTRLLKYKKILKPDGVIDFRTDDDELYFDTLNYISEVNGVILENSEDTPPTEPISHYELRFRKNGVKIKYIKFKF